MADDHEDMLWREDAVTRVLDRRRAALADQSTRTVSLEAIDKAVVAEDIVAEQDIPAHDFATMDGYAFDATRGYPYAVVPDDEVFPEDASPSIEPDQAVRIATGAPLPAGANAVLKREESTVEEGRLYGSAIEPGRYVRKRGVSVAEGEVLFQAGERLSPKDALLLAELGYEDVPVREPFRVGVLATGTEFVEGRATDLDSPMLVGLLRSWGHEATYEGAVADEFEQVTDAIERLATDYDVVVTTGGTSVGHKDYVIRALDTLGTVDFHRVRIRPGKPIAMANLPDLHAVVFAIPGKPVGAHTISTFVMGPFFTGETDLPTVDAELTRTVDTGPDGFEYMVPVTLSMTESQREAMPLGHVDSPLSIYERTFDPSVISSHTRTSRADGVVVTRSGLEAGDTVSVIPYSVLE